MIGVCFQSIEELVKHLIRLKVHALLKAVLIGYVYCNTISYLYSFSYNCCTMMSKYCIINQCTYITNIISWWLSCYCFKFGIFILFSHALDNNYQDGMIGTPLTDLTLSHVCVCPNLGFGFPPPYTVIFFYVQCVEVNVCFVDIDEIVDYHSCLKLTFFS